MLLQGSSIESVSRRVLVVHPVLDFKNVFSANAPMRAIHELADELDLTTMAAHWDSLLACAEEKAPSYTDFAVGLLRYECDARRRRKAERSLKR